jgi:hypothetical protein
VPANTGLTSASAGKLFKPSGYLLSLALAYYNKRNQLVKGASRRVEVWLMALPILAQREKKA